MQPLDEMGESETGIHKTCMHQLRPDALSKSHRGVKSATGY